MKYGHHRGTMVALTRWGFSDEGLARRDEITGLTMVDRQRRSHALSSPGPREPGNEAGPDKRKVNK